MIEKFRLFECPHCHKPVRVSVQTEILGVLLPGDEGNLDWSAGLSNEEKNAVDVAKESGILSAFKSAVDYGSQRPQCIERFFLGFLKTARPRAIPDFALKALLKEFPRQRVNVVQAVGVLAVVVEGTIRRFIPLELAAGKTLGGTSKLRTSADKTEYYNWLTAERVFSIDTAYNFNSLR